MQYLLQPKRSESIQQTTEAVERWECDAREYEHKFGKTLDKDVKIGVILSLAPLQVLNHSQLHSHILKRYAQVRTMLLDYAEHKRTQPPMMSYPWISRCWCNTKGEGNGKKDENEKGKLKAKAKTMPKRLSTFLDTVSTVKIGDT